MNEVLIGKVVVNMGVGSDPERMKKAQQVIQLLTGKKPVKLGCKVRIPDWGLKPGVDIGLKVTLRGKEAEEFLKKAITAKENKIPEKSFDKEGNLGFGIKEHINMPGVKYDPKVGILGFDVLIALRKRGYRVKYRKIQKQRVGRKQRVTKEDAIAFMKTMGAEVE